MIYDAFGRTVKPIRYPETKEVAVTSIRDIWSSYPSKGLTPSELANIFRQADEGDIYRQMELFEEMEEKDPRLFSVFQTRKQALIGLSWEIIPASEDKRDIQIAEKVKEELENIPKFYEVMLDLLDAIGKGFAVSEIIWDVKKEKASIEQLIWRHQKKFIWNATQTELRLITDTNMYPGKELSPYKFVIHRYKARSGFPARAGILRVCAWMYIFKNYAIKDWITFAEVYGMPLRLGKYEPGTSETNKEALKEAVSQLGTDAAGIISKDTEIEFIQATEKKGGDIYDALINLCNKEVTIAVLGQHLTTEVGNKGSYAAGKVQNLVRQDLLEADCIALASTLKNQLIAPFVFFNFGADAPVPQFKFQYEPEEDLKARVEIDTKLIEKGVEIPASYIRKKYNLPEPKTNEEVIVPWQYRQKEQSQALSLKAKTLTTGPFTPQQQAIEDLIFRSIKEARKEKYMEKALAPVIKLVKEAKSYEEIISKLYDLYPDINTDDMEDLLDRALFAAASWGRLSQKQTNG